MATEVGSLQASLSLDISQFSSGMKEAISLTKAFGQQLKQALGNDITQGFSAMQREVSEATQSVEQLRAKMATMGSSANLNEATRSFTQIHTLTGRVKGSLDSIVTSMRTFSKSGAEAQAATMRIKGSLDSVLQSSMSLSRSGDPLKSSLNASREGMQTLYTLTNLETGEMAELTQKAAVLAQRLISMSASPLANMFKGAADESQVLYKMIDKTTGKAYNLSKGASQVAQELAEASEDAAKLDAYIKQSGKSTGKLNRETKSFAKEMERANEKYKDQNRHLSNSYSLARDLKRIVAGIVLSQSFYALAGTLRELVAGSYVFMYNMEQAAIAFKYLLDDATGADAMITRLQDFAVVSPLDTKQVMKSTRQLMAMGFAAKSVVPTMQVLADTAAVFTNDAGNMADMLDHITLALGQMKSSGKIMTQELRQLYNAGVPVFSILQEELGLTADQVRNIGRLNIDSTAGVIAILKGLQKRYNGAAEEFTRTVPGAFQVIQDSLYVLANDLFQNTYEGFRGWINMVSDNVNALMQITRLYGVGGFFQALFPPESWEILRNLIGSLQELGKATFWLGQIFKVVFGDIFQIVLKMLSNILPPITILVHAFSQLAYWVLMNVPGVRALMSVFGSYIVILATAKAFLFLVKALKLGAIFGWVAKQVSMLWAALKLLAVSMYHSPIYIAFAALAAILAVLAWRSEAARASLTKLYNFLTGSNKVLSPELDIGFNTGDIMQPEFVPPNPDAEKFNGTLEDINENFNDMEDAALEADKAIRQTFNQSFDEVYSINPNEGQTGTGLSDVLAMQKAMEGLEHLLADSASWIPTEEWAADWATIGDMMNLDDLEIENPFVGMDLSTWSDTFWNELAGVFRDSPEWVAAAIATAVTALILSIIGSPIILAALVGFAAWFAVVFWQELQKKFGLTDGQGIATAITSVFGGVVAGLASAFMAILGAGKWATVKKFFSGIVAGFMEGGLRGGFKNLGTTLSTVLSGNGGLANTLKTGLGGFLKGMIIGAIVNFVTGAAANVWAAKIKEVFSLKDGDLDNAGIGQTIAGIIGSIIGGIFGGPGGAILGGALGNFVGSIFGVFWERTKADMAGMGERWKEIFIGNFHLGDGRPIGEKILGMFQGAFAWVLVPLEFLWKGILKPLVDGIGALFGVELSGPIEEFFSGLGGRILGFFSETWTSWTTWSTEVGTSIGTFIGENLAKFVEWFANLGLNFVNFFLDTKTNITTWFAELVEGFTTFFSTIWENLTTWITNTKESIFTWLLDTKTSITTWFAELIAGFVGFFAGVLAALTGWASETLGKIVGWIGDTFGRFSGWWANITGGFSGWASSITGVVSGLISTVWGAITGWLSNLQGTFSGFWGTIVGGFQSFGQGIYNAISSWIDAALGKVRSLVDSVKGAVESVKTGISNMSNSISSVVGSGVSKVTNFGRKVFGHAEGGIFNREHMANFAEGNKAEAIIPLENKSAMQPFVDAVANGITSSLGPLLAGQRQATPDNSGQQVLYVGTLIADDKSLKELERKMKVIRITEEMRSN